MAACANADQWTNGYPSESLLRQDIARGDLYLCLDGNVPAAVFCFRTGDDPTYAHIYDGQWLNGRPYGVIHRLAAARFGFGTASFCLHWALKQIPDIRIDTHEKNIPMQKVLLKNGFVYCGQIITDDATPRRAYQFTLPRTLLPKCPESPLTAFKTFARTDYARLLPLLLEADPCERIIQSYFSRCTVWGYERGNEPVAAACVLPLSSGQCELKNLAVAPKWRQQGIGSGLCHSVFSACTAKGFTRITVGTADTPNGAVPFYQKLGFQPYGRIKNFFAVHYPHPVYDAGYLCRDMITLRRDL